MSESFSSVARVTGVTHRYGDTTALDAVTLDIPSGRMVGFIGPDGVGKSSLLALIAGAKKSKPGGSKSSTAIWRPRGIATRSIRGSPICLKGWEAISI